VLYNASDGRTVVSNPKRRKIGCAQWCPVRTAIPSSFKALPTSSVVYPRWSPLISQNQPSGK
jgi:hypothetical protein